MMAAVQDEARAALTAAIPMGRMADAEEVESACLFLLSDEASFITCVELAVDGAMRQI